MSLEQPELASMQSLLHVCNKAARAACHVTCCRPHCSAVCMLTWFCAAQVFVTACTMVFHDHLVAHLWSSLFTQESFQLWAMSTRMIIWTIMNTPDPKRASQAAWQAQGGIRR